MSYTAVALSKYIIDKYTKEQNSISNLELQEILYKIQRRLLTENTGLAFNEDFEAWKFGPVIPSVYNLYCGFGGMPIRITYKNLNFDKNYISTINNILSQYSNNIKKFSLVRGTQNSKAWSEIYRNGMGNHWTIPKELIRVKG